MFNPIEHYTVLPPLPANVNDIIQKIEQTVYLLLNICSSRVLLYVAPSVEEAANAGDYEGVGTALASKLRDAVGYKLTIEDKTIRYDVAISGLK